MVRGNGIMPGETKQQHCTETKHKKVRKEAGRVVRPGESHYRQHVAISKAWCARERDEGNAGGEGGREEGVRENMK